MKDTHILKLPSWYLPHGGQFVRNQAIILSEKIQSVNILANVSLYLGYDKSKFITLPWNNFHSKEDGLNIYRGYQRTLPKFEEFNSRLWVNHTLQMFKEYKKKFGTPDIIHAHSALWGGYAACLIKRKYNIPYVITEHFSALSMLCDYSRDMIKDWHKPYYQQAYSEANYIIPVSDIIQPAIESFLTAAVPIRPISNILDTDYYHYKERIPGKEIKFVAANGFYFQKGYDTLLPAFDNACSQNSNIELTIVGENFDTQAFRDGLWKHVRHKDKIHFTGELDAKGVREEMWKADAFIMPSRAESQSVATLEALSTGLPIVATSTIPKIMTTKENSIVTPVEDIAAMTSAILELSHNLNNYNRKAISEHIKTVCHKDVFLKAVMEVYRDVLKK